MDHMRRDGDVTFWQWQRKVGDKWSTIELPASGDGYKTPLHDPRWDQTASGACWQTWGFHGFLDEDRALACLDLVRKYVSRPQEIRWPEFRLARIQISRKTASVFIGNASP